MSKLKKFISVMCAALLLVGSMMVNASATTAELKDTDDIFTLNNSAVKNADNELVITDNYDDLDNIINDSLGNKTIIKIGYDLAGIGQTILPKQVNLLTGWKTADFFEPEEYETVRRLGNNISGDTFTFESGSNTTVKYIEFRMQDQSITIPEGVTVEFINCSFNNTIVNNGVAIFDNCQFKNGKIENNGAAEYINGTKEPENLGTPSETHIPLGIIINKETIAQAVKGIEYNQEITYELSGTNKDNADVTVEVNPSDIGISAKVQDNKVILSGKPTKTGTVDIILTASAQGDNDVTDNIQLKINEPLTVTIEGQLDCVTQGQSGYTDYLDVYVTEGENGEKINYYDYAQQNSDAKLEVSLSPEGSGMTANWLFDTISVSGTPEKAGKYYVSVTLKDKNQVVTSNEVELRIYTGDETLKGQFETLDGSQSTWDMEPYEIYNSGHAVVPTFLKTIYGSHESGLYGIIGNNEAVGTDTLIIPNGCDITLENIKIYSSVNIIVEKGGCLTLSDSVAFGTIEVNGGTFSMKNSSALVDKLILNDSSILKDAQVISNGRFLTDGSDKEIADTVVIINGKVTAQGINTIEAECGHGDEPGQTALQVNGELVIPDSSILTVIGGGDELYAPGWIGGTGIYMNNGIISGEGKLIVKGGIGIDGPGGDGINGVGKITVAQLESTGGDSEKLIGEQKKGGDAIGENIIVTTKNPVLKGGDGNPSGSAVVTLISDKSDLKDIINKYENLNEQEYTEDTWKVFKDAMEYAEKILEDDSATQEQVDKAAEDLENAYNKLEKIKNDSNIPGQDNSQGTDDSTGTPQTSDTVPLMAIMGIMLTSGLIIIALKKKKNIIKKENI